MSILARPEVIRFDSLIVALGIAADGPAAVLEPTFEFQKARELHDTEPLSESVFGMLSSRTRRGE